MVHNYGPNLFFLVVFTFSDATYLHIYILFKLKIFYFFDQDFDMIENETCFSIHMKNITKKIIFSANPSPHVLKLQ